MVSAYVETIYGVVIGVMIGVIPALVAMLISAVVPSVTDRRFVRWAVAILAILISAAVGISLGMFSLRADQAPRMLAGAIIVPIMTLYAFEQGSHIGSTVRLAGSNTVDRGRSLSESAVEAVDASGQVSIAPSGTIRSIDGYPPLSASLRTAIAADQWRLPADLPLSELQARIEHQLMTEYDIQSVDVTVDPRGTATIAVGPGSAGIARQVPPDERGMTVSTYVPEGTSPGDEVLLGADTKAIEGTVLGVGTSTPTGSARTENGSTPTTAGDEESAQSAENQRRTTRVTVAVPTSEADALLGADATSRTVAVRSRETRPDYRALSLLDQAGRTIVIETIDSDHLSAIQDGNVDVFAARRPSDPHDAWTFTPSADDLEAGWQAVLVGNEAYLERPDGATSQDAGVIRS